MNGGVPARPAVVALLRHGAPLIAPGIAYGTAEIDALVPAMPLVLRRWRGRATLWSSPRRRCRAAAAAVGRVLNRRPRLDRRLAELALGRWEGARWDAVPRARLDGWARAPLGRGAPGGESGAGLLRRLRSFARLLRRRGGRHVVVTHGGPMRLLPALLAGDPVRLLGPTPPPGALLVVPLSRGSAAAKRSRPG